MKNHTKVQSIDDQYSEMQSTFISNYMELEEPQQEIIQKPNWCRRTFGPLKKGGIRMSVISLLAPCIGVGMLGLPSRAKDIGVIIEIFMICISAIISCLSMHILSWGAQDLQCSSYSELIQMSLGNKAKRIFEVITILYCLLSCTSIQISFQIFITNICQYFEVQGSDAEIALIAQLVFILPNLLISWQKSLYKLRYFSYIGVMSIFYLTLLVILDFSVRGPTWGELWQEATLFQVDFSIFQAFALTFFCFICHLFVFPIRSELHNPTLKRQSKVWTRQSLCCFSIYVLVGVSGYLNFLDQTHDWITHNYYGKFFLIGKMGMSFSLFFAVPMNILACRNIIHDMLLSDEMEYQLKHKNLRVMAEDGKIVFEVDSVDAYRNKIHIAATLGLQFGSAILALVIPEITKFMTLNGGLLGTTMVCLFPLMIYIKEYKDQLQYWVVGLELFAILCGWVGAIYSQF